MILNYWLHRILHECEASYALKDKGMLSIGWSTKDAQPLVAARDNDTDSFNDCMDTESRSKWYLWHFAQIQPGDIIVVPEFGGLFSVYEALDIAYEAQHYRDEIEGTNLKWNKGHQITWVGGEMYYAPSIREDDIIDIGFVIKFNPIVEAVSRYDYADAALTSRMKFRGVTANISDIKDSVIKAIDAAKASKPLNFYELAADGMAEVLLNYIQKELTPDKFENLVKWYMNKLGASSVTIPAKNESGKEDKADADVIVDFDKLQYMIYVQVKHYTGESDGWAIEQVSRYAEQKGDNDEYNYAAWVISSCNRYSDEAIGMARANGVRLIDGKEFSRMLIDAGISGVNDAF